MTAQLTSHLLSPPLIFRSHMTETEAKATIHHVQSGPLSFSKCLPTLKPGCPSYTCRSHAILPKASAKQDPSVIYNGGAHFITNWLGSQPGGQTITSTWG